MTTEITIPDFNFAAFYYGAILDALIQYKRINIPEHTDESPYDPLMQFIRMQALVGHLNHVTLDLVANEATLPTAKLQETVRNMLRLINYEMNAASPAVADIVFELSKVFTSSFEVIPERAQMSTERQGSSAEIFFEALTALTVTRTDQFSKVMSYVSTKAAGSRYEDHTTEANDQTPGATWDPWDTAGAAGGPYTPAIGDSIYFGHTQAMWNQLGIWLDTAAANIEGRWEYYDGNFAKAAPQAVIDKTGYLRIRLDSYLGATKRLGTTIRVMLNETTYYEDLTSEWNAVDGNFVDTTGYLGQTTPSTDSADYTIGSDWEELPSVDDGTALLTVDGDVTFTLPQTIDENWVTGEINSETNYWIRFRITEVTGPTAPVFEYARMDQDKQYVLRSCTQGRTQHDNPLGSSAGTANQDFESTRECFVQNSASLYVDEELWTEVDNFLSSRPTDKHYRIELGTNDKATFIFGDGVTGKIPPIGVNNIRAVYRYSDTQDGNVGANAITLDKTGLTYIASLWNPRAASGWTEAEGSSEASLERAKIAGPASLRAMEVALNGDDVRTMAEEWVAQDGSSPIFRTKAIEGGFGPKSIELIVVAGGGGLATAAQLEELQEYFNGNPYSYPTVRKRVVANQEVTAINYTPHPIDITATVYGTVTREAVENQLGLVFQPGALKDDGVTWEWEFGGDVPLSRISHEIFKTDDTITNVELTSPASPVVLGARELPTIGTLTITIA